MVLWWVPAGHVPTLSVAADHLALLRAKGPTADAFTFRHRFDPPTGEPPAVTPGRQLGGSDAERDA